MPVNHKEPRFSVIIPTLNRREMLREALAALQTQTISPDLYEIVVADNGSDDGTGDMLRAICTSGRGGPLIRYVCEPRRGSHRARNAGFATAKGEILGLIDDDIIVEKDWLENLTKVFSDPKVGIAGGKIFIQWINGTPPAWIHEYKRIKRLLGYFDLGDKFQEVSAVGAGNFAIRRDILLRVGGYNPCNAPGDPLIGDGETGLCIKVRKTGAKVVYVPDAIALHIQDAQRISLDYLRLRFANQGATEEAVNYREHLWTPIRLITNAGMLGIKGIICKVLAFMKRIGKGFGYFRWELRAAYFFGRVRYASLLARTTKFRQIILQNDWISEYLVDKRTSEE